MVNDNDFITISNIRTYPENKEIYGDYRVYSNSIPESHKTGEWIYDETDRIIYLDQFHKYQDEIISRVAEVLKEKFSADPDNFWNFVATQYK